MNDYYMDCRQGFAGWFETSAKDNLNINEAAQFLVQKIIENDKARRVGGESGCLLFNFFFISSCLSSGTGFRPRGSFALTHTRPQAHTAGTEPKDAGARKLTDDAKQETKSGCCGGSS